VTLYQLDEIARALVIPGKGILAADETVRTIGQRFEALGIVSTPESRRDYREMLFTTPELSTYISGVIMCDETIRQTDVDGEPLAQVLALAGIMPGIKVDMGTRPLADCPGEKVTEGLLGLRQRLVEYRRLGARFAKWRAVLSVTEELPSETCLEVNADALARYALLCQELGLVPIVEPEVLMDGAHSLIRAQEVTEAALERVFAALERQGVELDAMLLKPNMVVSGRDSPEQASVEVVAAATLLTLQRCVPASVAGVVFLSGGQEAVRATMHLNAINQSADRMPWRLTFSFGRALQDCALQTWGGNPALVPAAQAALQLRCRCNGAAAMGVYHSRMEAVEAEPDALSL
jgi:fructose-bisphosphate aldolase class I